MDRAGAGRERALRLAVVTALVALYAWVWWRNAWITDDPFITFRSVEQLLAGHGPRFNPHERVQAFTHPLWFALLVPLRALGMPLPLAAFALSAAAIAAAFAALHRRVRGDLARFAAAVALAAVSRTLLDFSSSGLETPLTLLLVVLFVGCLSRDERPIEEGKGPPSLVPLAGLAGALVLTRLDLALLVAPALALASARRGRGVGRGRVVLELLLGLAPFLLWTSFSWVYYGSPIPNTALAKLATGVAASELVAQGTRYLVVSAGWDLLLLPLLLLGFGFAWRSGSRAQALVAGGLLQVLYLVWIGGDFMAGRFLLPVAALALALAVAFTPRRALVYGVLPGVLAVGLLWPRSPLRIGEEYRPAWKLGAAGKSGIVDEKGNSPGSEWLRESFRSGWPAPASEPAGAPRVAGVLGRPGYLASLDQILVDPFALSDPLLARLPHEPPWQIGHFRRRLPDGYLESLASGENRIADPKLAALYADVRLLASAPILDSVRLAAAWRLVTRSRGVAPPRPCPDLVILAGPPIPNLAGQEVAGLSTSVDGTALRLTGVLALGESAGRWQMALNVPSTPTGANLRCRPDPAAAPIPFDLDLHFATAEEAAAAAALPPTLLLTRSSP